MLSPSCKTFRDPRAREARRRRRRHKRGVCQRGAPGPDPILAAPELARRQVRSANAMQEILVNLTNQANRDRQRLQTRKPAVHRLDVIHDFVDIAGDLSGFHRSLGREEILQRALGALDLTGEQRLLADVHIDEELWIRQRVNRSVQAAQRAVGLGEQALKIALHSDRGSVSARQGCCGIRGCVIYRPADYRPCYLSVVHGRNGRI